MDIFFILSKGVVGATNIIKSIELKLTISENLLLLPRGRIINPDTPALDANSQKYSNQNLNWVKVSKKYNWNMQLIF